MLKRLLALAGGLLICIPVQAAQLELLPPQEGSYQPAESLAFDVSQLPDEVAPRLALELDDVNVTEFIRREGEQAVLDLPIPIEAGLHRIRVVDYRPDGTIEEIGSWTVEVVAPSGIREASLDADVSVGFDYRVADHRIALDSPFGGVPGRELLRGAANMHGRVAGEEWSVDGRFPVLFRDDSLTQSGQPWDLGDFLVQAERGRGSVAIGHQTPDNSSLIMEGFHRRGVSGALELPEIGTKVRAFTLRADPISGFEEGLGIRDRDQRVYGVTTQSRLFQNERHAVNLETTYLRGRREGLGSGEAGFANAESGTAWSAVADAELFERRIQLRGEYARSRFDPAANGPGDSQRDDAFAVLLGLRPFGEGLQLGGRRIDWELTFELDEIGPDFESPANLFPDNDRRRQRVSTRLAIDYEWEVSAWFARTRYNQDGRESEPTFRDDAFQVFTRYSPYLEDSNPIRRWIGHPYVEIEYGRQRLKPISTPDPGELLLNDLLFGAFLPVYADQHQRTAGLRVGSQADRFSWMLGYLVQRLEDRTRLDPDTRSDGASMNLNYNLSAETAIGLTLQRDRFKQEDLGFQTTTWTGSTYGWWNPSERWSLALQAGLSRSRDSTSSVDSTIITLVPSVTWRPILPEPNRPGLSFTVDGTWQDRTDDVNHSASTDVFQVFLKVQLDLPIRLGGGRYGGSS